MDEQLKTRLIAYLDKLEAAAGKATDFAADQIPDVIHEWLAWMFWSHLAYAVSFVVAAALVALVAVQLWRWSATFTGYMADDHRGMTRLCALLFGGLLGVLFVGIAIDHSMTCVKTLVAPKIMIVEKISDIARGR